MHLAEQASGLVVHVVPQQAAEVVEAERRVAAGYPDSVFPEPLSWLVDEERRAAFEEADSHFESVYHLTLVFPQDAGKDGTVSVLAPVGSALLGLSVGFCEASLVGARTPLLSC